MSAPIITSAAREMHERARAARARMEAAAKPGTATVAPSPFRAYAPTPITPEIEAQIASWHKEHRATRKSAPAIIADVAGQHGLSTDDIVGPSRRAPVVAARHAAVGAVRNAYPDRGLPWLAQQFRRNHATIFYCLRKLGLPTAMAEGRAA